MLAVREEQGDPEIHEHGGNSYGDLRDRKDVARLCICNAFCSCLIVHIQCILRLKKGAHPTTSGINGISIVLIVNQNALRNKASSVWMSLNHVSGLQ